MSLILGIYVKQTTILIKRVRDGLPGASILHITPIIVQLHHMKGITAIKLESTSINSAEKNKARNATATRLLGTNDSLRDVDYWIPYSVYASARRLWSLSKLILYTCWAVTSNRPKNRLNNSIHCAHTHQRESNVAIHMHLGVLRKI